jgi:ferredoxin-type protein NapF
LSQQRFRSVCRCLLLLAFIALAWPWGLAERPRAILPSLSPHVAIGTTLALQSASFLTLLAVPMVLLALLVPRVICHYVCPTGFLQELIERLRPAGSTRWQGVPCLGRIIVLLTLGGAALGYPLFLWLDPLALFNGFLNVWHKPLPAAALWAGLGLPVLLVFDLLFPRAWCKRICPLGATQDLLAAPGNRWRARRCGAEPSKQPEPKSKPCAARRDFLAACAGAAFGSWAGLGKAEASPPLRPPGSVAEEHFSGVCIRCGNCAQACPARIIQADLGGHGLPGLLAPVLSFERDHCRKDCSRCTQVCPSGAITRLTLTEKNRRIIGLAKLNLDACWLANGRECTACIRACPYDALAVRSTDGGFSTAPVLDLKKCNGCGACVAACPTRPNRAVEVVPGFRG